jgi:hypothetical protein
MGMQSGSRIWVDLNQRISDQVNIKKMASYEAPWTHLLNGSNVKEETGIKFDNCLTFESSHKVSSLEAATELLISRIREYHSRLFGNEGIYLIHLKVEPDSNSVIRGEKLAYAPFYIVQALVDVRVKH